MATAELALEAWISGGLIDYLDAAKSQAEKNESGTVTISIYQDSSEFAGITPLINYSGATSYFVAMSPGLSIALGPQH